MKRRLFNFLAALLERLALFFDGRAPTLHRVRAVQVVHVKGRYSRDRAQMSHHCVPPGDLLPWDGGSWYCPKCRTMRTYQPVAHPGQEATAPHFVPRIRGRHNGHLRYTSGVLVDTGKLFVMPGRG